MFLRLLIYFIPIPYLTIQLGWLVAEVGRQPWIVYGVMRTSEGVITAISSTQVWVSLISFTLLYSALEFIDRIMTVVAFVFVPIVIVYKIWAYRTFRAPVTIEEVTADDHAY